MVAEDIVGGVTFKATSAILVAVTLVPNGALFEKDTVLVLGLMIIHFGGGVGTAPVSHPANFTADVAGP